MKKGIEKRSTWLLLFIKRTKKNDIGHQPIPCKSSINNHQLIQITKVVKKH